MANYIDTNSALWRSLGSAPSLRRIAAVRAPGGVRARPRRALARRSDHALKDLGVTRAEALEEAAKPFWRP